MKTAISIPDALFHRTDREARRRGLSRSRLVAHALEAFLSTADDRAITRRVNRVCAEVDTRPDPVLSSAQFLFFEKWRSLTGRAASRGPSDRESGCS